ncbi:uncharacterized protein MYCGRDRAFT_102176 [Zymoseptoria tritici IPO323]|uniref:Uncharacterized protein n=1 Tax=Zymoseptoria tritici (strain CBS 115943 / IPO323) TaxID=336722 RepID=F9WZV0_ZYMTI|nr:uncharacterized protein MYCGRDRAFT_102176 [Zymoseptoria tritici IPO323]EGP92562.1 hypothetical protein MYCGRDRAFT_102176 [Zymoseptoria tritici IPO323]
MKVDIRRTLGALQDCTAYKIEQRTQFNLCMLSSGLRSFAIPATSVHIAMHYRPSWRIPPFHTTLVRTLASVIRHVTISTDLLDATPKQSSLYSIE